MQYTELIIKIKTTDTEIASAIVSLLDIGGIYTEDYSDIMECSLVKNFALVDESLLAKDKDFALLHIYFDDNADMNEILLYIEERFKTENIDFTVLENKVKEDDYANSWKKYYKPLKIDKITVVPSWEEYSRSEGEIILNIDPGMAFGTGEHETTSLCIEALQRHIKKGDAALDIGCGSGILSIASLLLGAETLNATDIDPNAAKVTKENASLNSYTGVLNVLAGNILQKEENLKPFFEKKDYYDIVIANIVADVIIMIADFIPCYIKKGGIFIASGIISEKGAETEKALLENGFEIIEKNEKKGWLCFVSKKNK